MGFSNELWVLVNSRSPNIKEPWGRGLLRFDKLVGMIQQTKLGLEHPPHTWWILPFWVVTRQ